MHVAAILVMLKNPSKANLELIYEVREDIILLPRCISPPLSNMMRDDESFY